MRLIKSLKSLLLLFVFGVVSYNVSFWTHQYFQIWLDSIPSNWNTQYDITFLKKWVLNTNYLWTVKALIGLDHQYLLFWNQYWLYLFDNINNNRIWVLQWYFQYVYSCDEFDDDSWIVNCSSPQNLLWSDEVVSNFINTLSFWDWIEIYDDYSNYACWWYCTYDRYNISVCFSSQVIWKSLCFAWDRSSYNYSSYSALIPFTWSLNLDSTVNFGNISRWLLYNPPWFIAWGSNWTWNWNVWIVVWSCPTVRQLVNSMESTYWYNSWSCFSSDRLFIYSWWSLSLVNVTPQSILTLYPNYSDFRSDIDLYFNYCTPPASSDSCTLAFSWRSVNYSFINSFVNTYDRWRSQNFYNYCNAYLTLDLNATTCTLSTWSLITPWTEYDSKEDMLEDLVWSLQIYNYYNYNRGSSWNNETWFSFDDLSDAWSWVNSLFNSFSVSEWHSPVLPGYIIVAFLWIFLLYLFRH